MLKGKSLGLRGIILRGYKDKNLVLVIIQECFHSNKAQQGIYYSYINIIASAFKGRQNCNDHY